MNYKKKQEELNHRRDRKLWVYQHPLEGRQIPAVRTNPKPKRVGKIRRQFLKEQNIYGE